VSTQGWLVLIIRWLASTCRKLTVLGDQLMPASDPLTPIRDQPKRVRYKHTHTHTHVGILCRNMTRHYVNITQIRGGIWPSS